VVHFEIRIQGVPVANPFISKLGSLNLGAGTADRGEPDSHFLDGSGRSLHLSQNGAVFCIHAKASQAELFAGFHGVFPEEHPC